MWSRLCYIGIRKNRTTRFHHEFFLRRKLRITAGIRAHVHLRGDRTRSKSSIITASIIKFNRKQEQNK